MLSLWVRRIGLRSDSMDCERRAMGAIHAVIFDLDDTLYPERAYAFSGFAAVAAAWADRLGDPTDVAAHMGRLFDAGHRRRIFDALLAERERPVDRELVDRMIETYRTHRPNIALHPDADRALARLRSRFKLGLITDGPSESQWAKIDALDLRHGLDEIIVTSDLGPARATPEPRGSPRADSPTSGDSGTLTDTKYAKPHPRAFELMADRLSVDPVRCAYVADNAGKDFIAPNALGWTSIQVVRPDGVYRDEPVAPGGRPWHRVDDLDALTGILEQRGV